jgi:hypothetical protein
LAVVKIVQVKNWSPSNSFIKSREWTAAYFDKSLQTE